MLPATVVLAVQGNVRTADSRKLIADAMTSGRVASSSVARFKAWADNLDDVISSVIRMRDEEAERAEREENFRLEPPRAEERAQ